MHRALERLLGLILQIGVQREREVRARLRLALHQGIVGILLDVGEDARQARLAGQVVVEARFDAGVAVLLGIVAVDHAGGSDHVRGQMAVRVKAPHLGTELDPIELEAAHARRLLGGDLAFHPQESVAAQDGGVDLVVEGGAIHHQNPREKVGRRAGVGNLERVDADGFGRQALGQRLSGTVEDGAARGLDLHHLPLLLPGQL